MNDYLLVLGATSDIAQAVARRYAAAGYNLYLAGRDLEKIEPIANDIRIRYQVEVKPVQFDAEQYRSHAKFYRELSGKPAGVLLAFGCLGDQEKAQGDIKESRTIIETNFSGALSILNIIANDFEERQEGFIVAISSVAGDRGRKSNYIYGSAKAALTTYLSGLRNRLAEVNVQVMTVKPGFVNTRMTEGIDLPERLVAEPDQVAEDVFSAQQKRKDVIYSRWFWRLIMFIVIHIPERIFKKLSI